MKRFFYLLMFIALIACGKKMKNVPQESRITQFLLEASLNSHLLQQDLEAIIQGDSIIFNVPHDFSLDSVVPSFTTENVAELLVNQQPQISKKTKVSLSNETEYVAKNAHGILKKYYVKIQPLADPLRFEKFSIAKENNIFLLGDVQFLEKKDTLYGVTTSKEMLYLPSFTTNAKEVFVNGILQISGQTKVDFSNPVVYKLVSHEGFVKQVVVSIQWKASVPHLYITTEEGKPINSKTTYLKASFEIDGVGIFKNLVTNGRVRGRGNTTWTRPKKPYRIKLDNKEEVLGLAPAKDWVLLANHLDPTLMLTATSMKIGEQVGVQYVNHVIPIEVTINGIYQGQYNLTEQIEVKKNRVDLNNGVLLELDKYYDEDYKFKSDIFKMPVMFKYPDPVEEVLFEKIKSEFNHLEQLVNATDFPNNDYVQLFDIESFAKYLIVYMFTDNRELNHPKSIYMNKENDGSFKMGPIWDFDWAYAYEGSFKHFSSYNVPFFSSLTKEPGNRFFSKFLKDPKVVALLKSIWSNYKTNHFPQLLTYLDTYYANTKESRLRDYAVWKTGNSNPDIDYYGLRTWLVNRASYLDSYLGEL